MFASLKSSSEEEEMMNLLSIRTILFNLKAIANEVRTNFDFCRDMEKQLKDCGYDWFGSGFGSFGESEQVMKVLAVAVNEAIQKKVDLQNQSSVVNQELHQLLDIDNDKSLDHYFFRPKFSLGLPFVSWKWMLETAGSPLDMAEFLKKDVPQWFVKKMIEHQFDIRWNTQSPNGEPAEYSFYQFCDKAEKTTKDFNFFKYIPRQAHVKATLYKECRRRSVHYLRSISKEELCPIVYIRVADGWIPWRADGLGTFNRVSIENDLLWIDPFIRKFITENADEQKIEHLEDSLAKSTLYWAVLEDGDFMSGDELKLKSIGQTQVYVGKANNGIRGRWIKATDNHCAMMKKCLDNVCAMTTYDPSTLEGIQLVDARLALAKVRKEKTALFVIKTFGDDVEKAEIVQEKAVVCLNEAQRCVDEEATVAASTATLQRLNLSGSTNVTSPAMGMMPTICQYELEKRQEEFDEAKAVLDDLKHSKTSKAEAEAQLTRAEKLHRMGKRIHDPRKNIIPHKDYQISWKPKDMRYGMNCN